MAQTKTITVTGIEEKSTRVGPKTVVKDQDGKKFNFFNQYQGKPTYQAIEFNQLGIKIGSTVDVEYEEEEFTGQDGTKGVTKKVKAFHSTTNAPAARQPTNTGNASTGNQAPDWDAIAAGKIASNLIVARVNQGVTLEEAKEEVPLAFAVASLIMTYKAKVEKPQTFEESLNGQPVPAEPLEEEISVEDIPF